MVMTAPADSRILTAVRSFSSWEKNLEENLKNLIGVTNSIGVLPGATILRLESFITRTLNRNLKVAFVGEFSRGKSELINSLFFSDVGGRFLPSGTGQTTMCPIEITGNKGKRPFLRVLSIASRGLEVSIEKLKRADRAWSTVDLDDQKVSLGSKMKILTETSCVFVEEARKYGLCPPLNKVAKDREKTVCPSCGLGKVIIPRWRHAEIGINNPILNEGITVIDTPGLNAIGAEPELTFGIISEADIIVFVLSVDSGVTQSDLFIWEQYIQKNTKQDKIVLLNKIDTLWDDIRDPFEVFEEIEGQIAKTARMLSIDKEMVIPVSGQKALLAKIKNNVELLEKTGIMAVEKSIADYILSESKGVVAADAKSLCSYIIKEQHTLLDDKLYKLTDQINGLASLKEKTEEKISNFILKHKEKIAGIEQEKNHFEEKRQLFHRKIADTVMAPLDIDAFDLVISNAKNEMLSAWTTAGIVNRFKIFFDDSIKRFDTALDGVEQINRDIETEYHALQAKNILPPVGVLPYAMLPKRAELIALAEKYERFGSMLEIAVNTQNSVVRKSFLTVATQVRDYIKETRVAIELWINETIDVLNLSLENYKKQAEDELQSLEKIAMTMGNLDSRKMFLHEQCKIVEDQKNQLTLMSDAINKIVS